MLKMHSLIYFYSCHFLWSILSLFLYLDEEKTNGNLGRMDTKWRDSSENLAHWIIEEWHRPLEDNNLTLENKDKVLLIAEEFSNSLMFYFANTLNHKASISSQEYTILSDESKWLYLYYCRFLLHILDKFDQILKESVRDEIYYKHYQKQLVLFNDLRTAVENENQFFDRLEDVELKAIQVEIDSVGAKLAMEWYKAVFEAAQNKQLPNFVRDHN